MGTWFFFFKQKTAYEMRISDWSSDVCSSDLTQRPRARCFPCCRGELSWHRGSGRIAHHQQIVRPQFVVRIDPECDAGPGGTGFACRASYRSEEHTSELQSLMRISYAVFCLKKKKQKQAIKEYTTKNITAKHRCTNSICE